MMKGFDIFPKPYKVWKEWLDNCTSREPLDFGICLNCPYSTITQKKKCMDLGIKGDWALWMHYYDMNKPLMRRYVGKYAWEEKQYEKRSS